MIGLNLGLYEWKDVYKNSFYFIRSAAKDLMVCKA